MHYTHIWSYAMAPPLCHRHPGDTQLTYPSDAHLAYPSDSPIKLKDTLRSHANSPGQSALRETRPVVGAAWGQQEGQGGAAEGAGRHNRHRQPIDRHMGHMAIYGYTV